MLAALADAKAMQDEMSNLCMHWSEDRDEDAFLQCRWVQSKRVRAYSPNHRHELLFPVRLPNLLEVILSFSRRKTCADQREEEVFDVLLEVLTSGLEVETGRLGWLDELYRLDEVGVGCRFNHLS